MLYGFFPKPLVYVLDDSVYVFCPCIFKLGKGILAVISQLLTMKICLLILNCDIIFHLFQVPSIISFQVL